ncbi:MAG: hypothetical protein QM604_02075 [Microbacterium sp.]
MAKQTPQEAAALEKLLATDIVDVAARLFAATFPPESKNTRAVRDVHDVLAWSTGVRSTPAITWGRNIPPEQGITPECVLLWEFALLAARDWSDDQARGYVHLLRRGEAVRSSTDRYAAALAALTRR